MAKYEQIISELYLDWRTCPLKQKYKVYRSYSFGTYKSRTGNSRGGPKVNRSWKCRRKAI